jgi:hypothetical protein
VVVEFLCYCIPLHGAKKSDVIHESISLVLGIVSVCGLGISFVYCCFFIVYLSTTLLQQVKIWEDRKALPLAVLKPHDGHPVNSVTFLTAPHRPNHIVLITAVYAPNLSYVKHGELSCQTSGVFLE